MTFPNNSVIAASGWTKQNIYLSIYQGHQVHDMGVNREGKRMYTADLLLIMHLNKAYL